MNLTDTTIVIASVLAVLILMTVLGLWLAGRHR
jgi:hypothetical protein